MRRSPRQLPSRLKRSQLFHNFAPPGCPNSDTAFIFDLVPHIPIMIMLLLLKNRTSISFPKFSYSCALLSFPSPRPSTSIPRQHHHATTSATNSATNEPKSTATYVAYLYSTLELPFHSLHFHLIYPDYIYDC